MVEEAAPLLAENRPPVSRNNSAMGVFGLLFAAIGILTVLARKSAGVRTALRYVDRLLFIVAGLLGLFLLFMWFGTEHYCTQWNLNILWASPLLLLIAIRLERSPRWALWLQMGCFVVALVWVFACGLSPALIPIILMLALRVGCRVPKRLQLPQQPR